MFDSANRLIRTVALLLLCILSLPGLAQTDTRDLKVEIVPIIGHQAEKVAFSPDGRTVASASYDTTLPFLLQQRADEVIE